MKKYFKTMIVTLLVMSLISVTTFAVDHPVIQNGGTNVNANINNEQPGIVSVAYTPEVNMNFKYKEVFPVDASTLNFQNNGTTPVKIYIKDVSIDDTPGFWQPTTVKIQHDVNTLDWNTIDPDTLGITIDFTPNQNGIDISSDYNPEYGTPLLGLSSGKDIDTTIRALIPKRLSETSYTKFGATVNFIFESVYSS